MELDSELAGVDEDEAKSKLQQSSLRAEFGELSRCSAELEADLAALSKDTVSY